MTVSVIQGHAIKGWLAVGRQAVLRPLAVHPFGLVLMAPFSDLVKSAGHSTIYLASQARRLLLLGGASSMRLFNERQWTELHGAGAFARSLRHWAATPTSSSRSLAA